MTCIFGTLIAVLFLSVGQTASAQYSGELMMRALEGDAEAQVSIGDLFYSGIDVEQNHSSVVMWYQFAAEQGNADAEYKLGASYEKGEGIERDSIEAVKWYRLAAEQGHADAQFNLGAHYYYGQSVIQDLVYAHMWWNISASLGNEWGSKALESIVVPEMTPEQIAEAQKLARECVRKEYKDC